MGSDVLETWMADLNEHEDDARYDGDTQMAGYRVFILLTFKSSRWISRNENENVEYHLYST